MTIINGKKIAQDILAQQKKIIQKLQFKPKLATILIGKNEASRIYINEKRKIAKKIGINFKLFTFPNDVHQPKIIKLIKKLNTNKTVNGIIVQLPLPKNLNTDKIVQTIDPKKDADGFHQQNIQKFLQLDKLDNILDKNLLLPVTPAAVIEVLNQTLTEKPISLNIIFIGKPSIFTKPLIHYFKKQSFQTNFQILSPDDPHLTSKSQPADILITACGRPGLIKKNMVKPKAIVIDIGIMRQNSQVVGDIDFKQVKNKVKAITPVPGGIGPITVAILMRNVVFACNL